MPNRLKFAIVTATSHWRVSLKTALVQSALHDHDPYAASEEHEWLREGRITLGGQ